MLTFCTQKEKPKQTLKRHLPTTSCLTIVVGDESEVEHLLFR